METIVELVPADDSVSIATVDPMYWELEDFEYFSDKRWEGGFIRINDYFSSKLWEGGFVRINDEGQ